MTHYTEESMLAEEYGSLTLIGFWSVLNLVCLGGALAVAAAVSPEIGLIFVLLTLMPALLLVPFWCGIFGTISVLTMAQTSDVPTGSLYTLGAVALFLVIAYREDTF